MMNKSGNFFVISVTLNMMPFCYNYYPVSILFQHCHCIISLLLLLLSSIIIKMYFHCEPEGTPNPIVLEDTEL